MVRTVGFGFVVAAMLGAIILVAGGASAPLTWMAKPLRYVLLDMLILSSPVWIFLASLMWADPRWQERLPDWRSGRYGRVYTTKLRRIQGMIGLFLALAVAGVLVLAAHLLRLV